jgi:NAD(P)-dependent dehydrogenase (short-subunit alcohol dehydrogenase family)
MSGELAGRTALITGGTQGLGLEIAHQYLRAGIAGICICGRDESALASAADELRAAAGNDQEVVAQTADVSDPREVDRLLERTLDAFPELTILVNNAGVYGPKGTIGQVDWAEWARAIEINLYGSVLPARALTSHFRARGYGKVVQLSGGGATAPLAGLSAYAASKAAVVRFAETLAVELAGDGVDVNAIAPGALNTRMLDEVIAAGAGRVGESFYQRALQQRESGGTPLARGAELAVFLASEASDGITGRLLSAVWDPWADLPERLEDLRGDVYTLRRIVPADRGMDWGEV